MIKYLVGYFFAAACFMNSYASGDLDRVDIYLNGKLVGTWDQADVQNIHLDTIHEIDTIFFHAWTNIENGLSNATLDVKDNSGVLISHINSSLGATFEANFTYIIKPQNMDGEALKVLHAIISFSPEQDVQTVPIALITLAP